MNLFYLLFFIFLFLGFLFPLFTFLVVFFLRFSFFSVVLSLLFIFAFLFFDIYFSEIPLMFVAACSMMVARAHMYPAQCNAAAEQQPDSGSRQGHPRYTGARSAGRPWVARTTGSAQHTVQKHGKHGSGALATRALVTRVCCVRADPETKNPMRRSTRTSRSKRHRGARLDAKRKQGHV